MTRYLVIDTEGSGLFKFKNADGTPYPADAPDQPRLAALSMIYIEEGGTEIEATYFIQPDGWKMDPQATAVNGLTDEFLMANGMQVAQVLSIYTDAIKRGYVAVAFNAQFDLKQLRGELRRAGMPDLFEETPNICVMRGSMGIVKKQDGKGGWPKLSDACAHFGIAQEGAHTSIGDARAVVGIMRALEAMNALPPPAVHHAKNHPGDAKSKGKKAKPEIETDENGIPL